MIASHYHERTKHYFGHFAKSLGYLDWANQPNPYRNYEPTKKLALDVFVEFERSYKDLFTNKKANEVTFQSVSAFFRYAFGLAAKKSFGGSSWELRINASSGNLHPTEAYAILPAIKNFHNTPALYHYNAYRHELELLAEIDLTIPDDSMVLFLTSVIYREMWKYGERCYRYCALDLGHAYRAAEVSAKLCGFDMTPLALTQNRIDELLGLKPPRVAKEELESGDVAFVVGKNFDASLLQKFVPPKFSNQANRLANLYQRYEIVKKIDTATKERVLKISPYHDNRKVSQKQATEVLLKRRSAQAFDPSYCILYEEFMQVLKSASLHAIDFLLYVHNVKDLQAGLYLYRGDKSTLELTKAFEYKEIEPNLYLLQAGDVRFVSGNLFCKQAIAADCSFALSMVVEFWQECDICYKEQLFECGRVGQQLYLEATSLGFDATGIGCFFDDAIHNLFGIETSKHQVLYSFTVGKALRDSRIMTQEGYEHLKAMV